MPDSPSRLAALVHDLNQPLAAILSNAQAAQHFLASDQLDVQELREILRDIVRDDKRAAGIVLTLGAMLQESARSAGGHDSGSESGNLGARKEHA
jgi:two-component system, LuxR family, sensor kinase FixL